jgi:hypothetical protein
MLFRLKFHTTTAFNSSLGSYQSPVGLSHRGPAGQSNAQNLT